MIDGKKIVCMIPARLKSTRFPEKPLKEILGLPMIIHVLKRAEMCKELDAVYVVTDDEKIKSVVESHGGKAIMTGEHHQTGTDRIGEAVENMDCDIVINVQGDEPLMRPEHILKCVQGLLEDDTIHLSCLCVESDQFNNADEVKLVLNEKNEMMYFSRADIPSKLRVEHKTLLKQYCIYAFEKDFLLKYINWEQTPLEKIEFVELMRVIEKGYKIKGVKIDNAIIQSVDTEEDRQLVEKLMEKDDLKDKYL